MKNYTIKEFASGRRHVLSPGGLPVYDGAYFGNEKPLVFTDPDLAQECANQLSEHDNPKGEQTE